MVNVKANVQIAGSNVTSSIGDNFMWVINALLYIIFNIASLTVSLGATMLEFVLDPVAFTGLFNLKAVYDLWKMIRDFFNLFFILMILFIAFATIFQVQAYNYKKLLWQLVLMALLVNFSFPVSRFIIDMANVPMYFFLNSIAPDSATGAGGRLASSFFTAASLKTVLLPAVTGFNDSLKGGWDLSIKILQATIFVFIFGISVLSLSVLLFIRAITLLALVIFSPVGFIGTAIPWFSSLAGDWWKKLLSNAFFGPTAALMLLCAVKIMQAFSADTSTQTALNAIAAKNSASMASSINLASLAVFAVPIIFIWMSMTVGKSFGIAGADKVIGSAQKFATKAGRKVSGMDAAQRNWKEYQKVRQERKNAKFQASNIGSKAGRFNNRVQDFAGRKLAPTKVSRNFARDHAETAQQARIKEEATKNRINDRTTDAELRLQHEKVSRSPLAVAHLTAVTQEMAKREHLAGEITANDKARIDHHYKDMGGVTNAVAKDTKEAIAKHNANVAYNGDIDELEKAFKSGKIKMEDQAANAISSKVLTAALESNKLDQKVLEELSKDGDKAAQFKSQLDPALAEFETNLVTRLSAVGGATTSQGKALLKQQTNAHKARFFQEGDFHATATTAVQNNVFNKSDATTMKNMSAANMVTYMPQIVANLPSGKTTTIVSNMAEDDTTKAKNFIAAMKREEFNGSLDAHASMERLRDDHRTRKLV
ncbi:MAG: hypothetical protein WCJ25_03650 [Candidatus Moraniibacteriota bacterium]